MAERRAAVEGRIRILVVDDEPETARLLRTWFQGQPCEILDARNGQEGLAAAAREKPDIIVLDLRMPGLDGHEVARTLKGEPGTSGIPIILLSASSAVPDKVNAFKAGVDDYVVKPFDFEEMDARIRAMLGKRDLYRKLQAKNEQLSEQLIVDEKTGANNYRQFQRRLAEEWLRAERYGMPLSLVMLDLDDFKRVNDTLGHRAGDLALREFATLVAGGARATDLAARYGGEEFAIILPHTTGTMAALVAERIRAAVREFAFLPGDTPIRLTVSAGVATYPSHPDIDSPDALVRAADRALYRAKEQGKNRVVVDGGAASTPVN
jgi:two-component system, cell cycle response regulator